MSPLQQTLADYLALRHSLGHTLAEAGWLLPSFVAYLEDRGLRTVTRYGADHYFAVHACQPAYDHSDGADAGGVRCPPLTAGCGASS